MKNLLTFLLLIISSFGFTESISPGLTAVYEDKRQLVKIKWNHNDQRVISYWLQRSSDNNRWTDIYRIAVSPNQQNNFISYTDPKPDAGKNFYRLKAILMSGSNEYSNSIIVIIGNPGNNWMMYPVPVRDILNLQYNGSNLIEGVISVTIQNTATRQIFQRLRMASTTRFMNIPVTNLGKGLYLISISIGNKIVWNQQFSK
jgi:hypothetical protein